MESSVQRFRSPEHYHQSNLQTVRHTTSTNSLSHRQTKTQEHPFLKPVLNTRAEEASGDGQLNDRVIDSLNHVDVQFFGHLSIWDWHFSVFSLPLSSMLSVRRSIHCPLPAASPLSYFYPLIYSYLPFSFVFLFFSVSFSHARNFSCGYVGAYNSVVAYVCSEFPRACACLWSCLCTSVRLQPCLYRMCEGKVAGVRVHGREAVCARVCGLRGCKGMGMTVDLVTERLCSVL